MARVLAYTSPARGHLYPIVPTLLELRDRGHEVHVRTLASEVPAMHAEGLQARAITEAIEDAPLDDWEGVTPEEGLARALATFTKRAAFEVTDLQDAIAMVNPDLLLIDVTTVGAAAVAESSGLPWAMSIPLFQHFSFGPEPPSELTLVPFAIHPAGIDVLNGPRRKVSLAALEGAHDVWRAPLHLYYTAEPFQPTGMRLPPSFRLVGPGIWEPPARTPAWLRDTDRPVVLVSASSELQRDDMLIRTALEALDGEPVRVVVTTAAHDPSRFKAPANARVERWLPHAPVIDKAVTVVCHGGMGIIQKALAGGVPVCVVPFGRDQFEVAKRVAAADAGTIVTPDALDATVLRRAIREAIDKREGPRRIAVSFRRAGGAPAAAGAIESLLSDPTPVGHRQLRHTGVPV
jgi:MGT family glycosyltransferase